MAEDLREARVRQRASAGANSPVCIFLAKRWRPRLAPVFPNQSTRNAERAA